MADQSVQSSLDLSAQEALDALPADIEAALTSSDVKTIEMFARGPSWTSRDIEMQWRRVGEKGWREGFAAAAAKHGFDLALLLGIGSRESNIESIIGDHGHGHGIMQIDDRFFRDFCQSGDWANAALNIMKGAEILAQALAAVRGGQGRSLVYRDRQGVKHAYTGAQLSQDEQMRTTVAAYNSGSAAFYYMSEKRDPDAGTTGRDYSADTLKRAGAFAALLVA